MAKMDAMKRQSATWYNDALTKAGIRDLSGALASLQSALRYDGTNLRARNLLGLIQYARGEVPEALSTWMLARAMNPRDPLSRYFIESVQGQADELQAIDVSIHKYNQGLRYCRDGNADLAVLQLAEAVDINPGLLRAWQLLALIYLTRRQYAKARQALGRARAIDEGDELTLTYWHELKRVRPRRISRDEDDGSRHSVSYKRGGETIIRPMEQTESAGTGKIWTNIVIGLILGAAVVFLLAGPLIRGRANREATQQIAAYTDKIAAQEAQIDALKTELEEYRRSPDNAQTDDDSKASAKDSYEYLMKSAEEYSTGSNSQEIIVRQLLSINKKQLGEKGLEMYEKYAKLLFPKHSKKYFELAKQNYDDKNYEDAITSFRNVLKMEEDYGEGEAMLLLANAYARTDNEKKAKSYYKQVIKNHPDSDYAKAAESGLKGKVIEPGEAAESEEESEETEQSGEQTTDDTAAN